MCIRDSLNVVRALCSRVIVVYKGEIVEEGDVYKRQPVNSNQEITTE